MIKILNDRIIENLTPEVENNITKNELSKYTINYLKSNKIELPNEKVFRRIINLAFKKYYTCLFQKIVSKLYNRIFIYDISYLIRLKSEVKYSLFSIFLYKREKEILDNIVNIFIQLIRKIENTSEKSILENTLHEAKKINKYYFELCLLEKLEKYIKCKEIYIEKAHKFRDPCEDLPKDWETNSNYYYHLIDAPLSYSDFLQPIKVKLENHLAKAEKYFRSLIPLYTFNINPYGYFNLDLTKNLFWRLFNE